ncbi:Uncharacterised protein g4688 [Pycnogonum litorale]
MKVYDIAVVCIYLLWSVDGVNINHSFNSKYEHWSDAAFRYVNRLNCEVQTIMATEECWKLLRISKHQMTVYIAEKSSSTGVKLIAQLPDGQLGNKLHDNLLAIDPYPDANFGHLVIVFFVDDAISKYDCEDNDDGIYIYGTRQCMSAAIKKSCRENRNWDQDGRHDPKCVVNFLPFVYRSDDKFRRKTQLLECKDGISGFGKCPILRPFNETLSLMCDPIYVNTHRCSSKFGTVHTKCRLFEICDQAVVITGGWNRDASLPRHIDNTRNFLGMLRENGFKKGNIKVFFANGMNRGLKVLGDKNHQVYPVAKKSAMRYHINKMCNSAHCVDSFVMYVNGPATHDGSILLWDVDSNGIVGTYEKYTVDELMEDLEECLARRIFIVADYSYSGRLAAGFESSSKHKNVQVFASGRPSEYSYRSEFTDHWAHFKHLHTCTSQVQQASQTAVRNSNPTWYDGSKGSIKTNIFGAPCSVAPPFTRRELQRKYLGCQTVPTKIWMTQFLSSENRR